ncbi:glycosyltransferase family 2 protein [Marilutibacter aestuarii]|uniref:glycosyltransferase family 2 protein n=1 Tax=Marilutibacter aestuarii TaxID=1706195 RepID=UPI0011436045|nr:glycosyltransferase family 2 protein [Lysobacter aestuarii]
MLFWVALCIVGHAYVGYPVFMAILARWRGRDPLCGDHAPTISVVLAVHDEEARVAGRIRDVLAQDYPAGRLEMLVVNDGSRDGTSQAARIDDARVRVIDLEANLGKSGALNRGVAAANGEILVFIDARQSFGPGALRALVAPFADPSVGGVSGELVIGDGGGNPGLYWRMEKRLRHDEARLGCLHGVSGAIHALRRELFVPIPPGTVLDDMWTPLQTLLAGHRVWMARDAIAIDQASHDLAEEFHRKLRTLAGNWQLIERMPVLLSPLANPVFLAWFSHKFLRLVVPWALLVALLASAWAPGPFYRLAFVVQLLAYAGAALGWARPALARRVPLLPAAGMFLMLNSAALLSLPASLAWDGNRLWRKH